MKQLINYKKICLQVGLAINLAVMFSVVAADDFVDTKDYKDTSNQNVSEKVDDKKKVIDLVEDAKLKKLIAKQVANGSSKRVLSIVRAGDEVSISMLEDTEVTYKGPVSTSGLIDLPYLGRFLIAGLNEKQAEEKLKKNLEHNLYQVATVSVAIVKRAPGHVYVFGAVKQPGKVELPEIGEMTILQLLSEVHGVTTWAEPEKSFVLRDHKKIAVDIKKAFQEIDGNENIVLKNNDTVVVASITGFDSILSNESVEVIVAGQVRQPGIVEFAPGEQRNFIRAIFKAGNFTKFAKKSKVRVFRYNKDGSREKIVINAEEIIDDGKLDEDIKLESGDMIIVDERRFI